MIRNEGVRDIDLAVWGHVFDREQHGLAPVGDPARVADGATAAPNEPSPARGFVRREALPGFVPALGVSLFYLGLLVLIPLGFVFLQAYDLSLAEFLAEITSPRALAAYRRSFGAALAAAGANTLLGLLVAWVLVRCSFPGRRIAHALVDLPFALPTAVAGIALTAPFAHTGALGGWLEATFGVRVASTPIGVWIALVLVSLPFVIRTLEPVLRELDVELEDACERLAAGRLATLRGVALPVIAPALLSGFTLAFARALSEYGSLVFISSNLPLAPLLVTMQLEPYDHASASAIAVAMLIAAFALLFGVHAFQRE
jgi:sulfate/thiosulfate transport system permease protein